MLARYLKPDLLIVDDMGMKNLAAKSGELLFEIIMRRYETRSTMMTSNRPLEDWGKLIGDVPSATAILDRFLHHAEVIPISGRSYRLRNQPRNETPSLGVDDATSSKPAIPPTGSAPNNKRKKNRRRRKRLARSNDSNDYQTTLTPRLPIPPATGCIQSAR